MKKRVEVCATILAASAKFFSMLSPAPGRVCKRSAISKDDYLLTRSCAHILLLLFILRGCPCFHGEGVDLVHLFELHHSEPALEIDRENRFVLKSCVAIYFFERSLEIADILA